VDYPFKREAFIYSIITLNECYNVYECWQSKNLRRIVTQTTDQQWYEATNFVSRDLLKNNIHCSNNNVMVGFNRVEGISWNPHTNCYDKIYKNEVEYLPLQMICLERHESHYLSLEPRMKDPLIRFEHGKSCMILDKNWYGLTAQIDKVSEKGVINEKFKYYDVSIKVSKESKKIRNAYFAKNICKNFITYEPKYSSVDHICKRRHKSLLAINRITSSIFIKYFEGKEKKTVDIGLKLRNNNQKLHIPIDVIYSEKVESNGHVTQFWGFSKKAEDVIINYLNTFPWIEEYVEARAHHEATLKISKYHKTENRMNTLEDAMPFMKNDDERLLELKRLTDWLAGCELSKRSFVPAGFRFLSKEARDAIDEAILDKSSVIEEKIPLELTKVDPRIMFSEVYPFWCPPQINSVKDFTFGDRVANINTTKRKYIPFGELGTVVGTTIDGVIVRFDEPNVSLTDVHNTCPIYTGAVVRPESLLNLTQHADLITYGKPRQNVRQVEEHTAGPAKKSYQFTQKPRQEKYQGPQKYFHQPGEEKKHEKAGHKGQEHGQGLAPTGPKYGDFKPKKMNKKKQTYYGYDY